MKRDVAVRKKFVNLISSSIWTFIKNGAGHDQICYLFSGTPGSKNFNAMPEPFFENLLFCYSWRTI